MGYGGHFRRNNFGDEYPKPQARPFSAKLRRPVDYAKLERQLLDTQRRLSNPDKQAMAGCLLAAVKSLRDGSIADLDKAQAALKRFDMALKDRFGNVLPAPFCRVHLRLTRNDLQKLAWGK